MLRFYSYVATGLYLRWLERAPDKGEVGGSSPPRPTTQFNDLAATLESLLEGWCTFWFTPAPIAAC